MQKEEQLAQEAVINAKADKLLAQEEIWIRKGVEARRTRSQSRISRLQEMRAQPCGAARTCRAASTWTWLRGSPSGKIVAELTDASKSFGAKTVVRDFSDTILRGDKVGLIGPNGAGKTTLLKLILGDLEPDSGKVRRGTNLEVAYFDQMREKLDLDATLEDFISPGSEWIEIGKQRKHVKSYLSDFLFSPARANSPVRSLSGGERNRLLLARLFARPANVLVLDEPTNDLDIDTLELLEDLLQNYDGTVFLVSHDRTFLDNVVTSTIAFEGDGYWREYEGGVQDWLIQSKRAREINAQRAAAAPAPAPAPAPVQRRAAARRGCGTAQEAQLQGATRARRAAGPDRGTGRRAEADHRAAGARRRRHLLDGGIACGGAWRAPCPHRRRVDGGAGALGRIERRSPLSPARLSDVAERCAALYSVAHATSAWHSHASSAALAPRFPRCSSAC